MVAWRRDASAPTLYHRLAVVILELVPLRQRGKDIVVLAEHLLRQYAEAHGVNPKRLSRDTNAWLLSHAWPGNVRELSHLMERATLLCPETTLNLHTLERLCLPLPSAQTDPLAIDGGRESLDKHAASDSCDGGTGSVWWGQRVSWD